MRVLIVGQLIAIIFLIIIIIIIESSTTTALLSTTTVSHSSLSPSSSSSKTTTATASTTFDVTNISSSGGGGTSGGEVVGLYRYAVKGLTGDNLQHFHDGTVQLDVGETFPDDRRYAFLIQKNKNKNKSKNDDDKKNDRDRDDDDDAQFDPINPVWLHKQNFLCAFSDPEFMSQFLSKYDHTTKLLDLYRRNYSHNTKDDERNHQNNEQLLKSIDLSTESGRQRLADFFTNELKDERKKKDNENYDDDVDKLTCVTAASSTLSNKDKDNVHSHQFGNTSSGWKRNKDTRTVHIINAATVRQVSDIIGIPIDPLRFRPNIIVDGLPPWEEFDHWVGPSKTQKRTPHVVQCGEVKLSIISRTVRCQGVCIDPNDGGRHVLDMPSILTKHFPQYGPYLGVYAQVSGSGKIAVGDSVQSMTIQ